MKPCRTMGALLCAALFTLSVQNADAGAWSQPRGHLYAKLSGISYSSDEIFDAMGKRAAMGIDEDRFDANQTFLYLEYGLFDRLTLVAKTSAGRLVAENHLVEMTTRGIGDADLGLKYQLVDKPLVLASSISLKLPTGYHKEYDPALGTGEIDLEFRLLAARSLYPLPLYVGAETGYRLRGGLFSNQIPYLFEAGASPHQRLFIKGYVDGVETLSKKRENAGLVGLAQVSEGDLTKMGLNAAFKIAGSLWIDLLWERTVTGENVGAGSSVGVGLAYAYAKD